MICRGRRPGGMTAELLARALLYWSAETAVPGGPRATPEWSLNQASDVPPGASGYRKSGAAER